MNSLDFMPIVNIVNSARNPFNLDKI